MTAFGMACPVRAPARQLWLAVLALPVCGMVLAALQRGLLLATADRTASLGVLLTFDAWTWGLWMAMTPVIVALARRWPFRDSTVGDGLRHLVASVVLSTVHTAALDSMPRGAALWSDGPSVLGSVIGLLTWRLAVGSFVYGSVVAVTLALDAAARARAEELATSRAIAESARARLHALQMQIQPHFVFNTLNTAAMMARNGDAAGAANVITQLADMLRELVTEAPGALVALRDEIAFVQRYLAIEQARFGQRLRPEILVPPDALAVEVPRFILQPVVENAVQHGLSRSPTSGAISITAALDSGGLTLRVTDDGPGPATGVARVDSGIGLANTRSRLAVLYGDAFALTLDGDDHGTTTTIRLPAGVAAT